MVIHGLKSPLLVIGLVSLLYLACAQGGGWEIIRFQDQDYVSTDSIRKFYQFSAHRKSPNEQKEELFHQSIQFKIYYSEENPHFTFNKVKFFPYSPPVWLEAKNQLLIESRDLALVIDPVVRPSRNGFLPKNSNFYLEIDCPDHKQGAELREQIERLVKPAIFSFTTERDNARVGVFLSLNENTEDQANSISSKSYRTRGPGRNLSIVCATALHARLLLDLNLDDEGIAPLGVDVKGERSEKPTVEIEIHHEINDAFLSQTATAIFKGLEKLTMATAKPPNELPSESSPVRVER